MIPLMDSVIPSRSSLQCNLSDHHFPSTDSLEYSRKIKVSKSKLSFAAQLLLICPDAAPPRQAVNSRAHEGLQWLKAIPALVE
ncbi:hypothetical protein CEXT_392831 [Caerostris extrusa]|uniref:Uncharacterized protein n=1 Tax=Caerostris extrusa TaxID=172846 RepID=A0AAV4MS74_CAEEX|nr:hypothetical protein CEXT_392831 [Caerostris extrusa]